jgi:hypothetical protein
LVVDVALERQFMQPLVEMEDVEVVEVSLLLLLDSDLEEQVLKVETEVLVERMDKDMPPVEAEVF